MNYNFIDTQTKFVINGQEFIVDVGETSIGEKAEEFIKSCVGEFSTYEELKAHVAEGIDRLLGEGSFAKIVPFGTILNELQLRHLGLSVGGNINKKRVEFLFSVFKAKPSEIQGTENK